MVTSRRQALGITAVEAWALAQVIHRKQLPANLPLSKTVTDSIDRLSIISDGWRGQVLQEVFGRDIATAVMNIPPDAKVPTILKTAQVQPYIAPVKFVGEPEKKRETNLILADKLKDLPTPTYGLEDYPIYMGCLNALVGPSGTGKSFVAVDIAGKMVLQGATVVYIAAEGIFGYSDRWEVWKAHNHIAENKNLIFYTRAVDFMSDQGIDNFMEDISQYKPEMLIVDTVARCMLGADENSTRDMGLFVSACDKVIHALGTGVLAVHHTGKDGKMRGSSALFGACDSVLFLQRSENSLTIFNSLDQGGKNKYSAEAKPKHVMFLPKVAAVGDREFESVVLVPAQQMTTTSTDTLTTNQRLILDVLEAYDNGAKASQIQEMTQIPLATVYRQMATMKKNKWVIPDGDRFVITDEGISALR